MRRQIHKPLRRLAAIARKEVIQRVRDRRTLTLIVTIPLIELLLFSYAVDLTADHLPTAVADLSLDAQSQAFLQALSASGFFDLNFYVESEQEVIRAIDKGRARAGVVIPPGLAADLERGTQGTRAAQALIILDGSDSFSVQSGYRAATAIAQVHALELAAQAANRRGDHIETSPITASTRVLYNPDLDDLVFIMPGLVAILLQVLAVNTTAHSVVREYELGTIEQLLVTPVRPIELLLGKLAPNALLSFLVVSLTTLVGVLWFGVPFRGSILLFGWLVLLFILSCLGLGLLISTLTQTQNQTQQITSALMLLSQLLTGFIYPRGPMPPLVKAIGNLIPLTYFIRIARGIMTKGVGLTFLWSDVLALIVYAILVTALAATTSRKRLD
jgi:ABC-2 type transport system permease protein